MTTTAAGTVTTNFALLCPATCARVSVQHGSSGEPAGPLGGGAKRGAVFAPAGVKHDQGAALVCGPASRGRGAAGGRRIGRDLLPVTCAGRPT